MKIHDMTLLVRVAEAGSMTRAAKQLHLTPAAVSAAVQRMEKHLGVRLFERTTRSLRPTDEGLVVLEGCIDIVDRWHHTLDQVQGDTASLEGIIHLASPADTAYHVLQSVIVDFCLQHPLLRVVLSVSDTIQHLHRDALDMAVRYGPLQDSTLTARLLYNGPAILVASPDYIRTMGTPDTPQSLTQHRCVTLQLSNVPVLRWQLHGADTHHTIAVQSPLCGDGHLTRQWALAGRGIALKSLFDVIDDLEAGRLVRVLPDYTGGRMPIHLIFPSRRFQPARVRALSEAIVAHVSTRATRCHGWLASR